MRKPKIIFVRKKMLAAVGFAAAAALMFCAVHSPAAVGAYAAQRQLPIYCVEKDYKVASLSFDAAWGDVRVRQPSEHKGLLHSDTFQGRIF